MIPIARPAMGDEERELVWSAMASGQLAQGSRVRQLEEEFAAFVGTRHAVVVSSGTAAIHLTMLGLGIGEEDEVITVSFTFFASASAVVHAGARPVFVDIDPQTYTMDPELVAAAITPRTRAIMPVSLYGQMADLSAIGEIADRHGLTLIEDACQSHGAQLDGRPSGGWGNAVFSFYATKNMTTGEGGAVTTRDPALADRVRLLREHGMRVRYQHEIVGYNFRMTDIHASIGLAQLAKLPAANGRRQAIAARYTAELRGVGTPFVRPNATHVYHQYVIRVAERDAFLERLQQRGVGAAVHYPIPVHQQQAFAALGYRDLDLPVTERLAGEVLSLPVHPSLTDAEVDAVIAATNEVAAELGAPDRWVARSA
jgi:dTDP-4-amino-4,6-dideoxygalactose transaminase